MLLASKESTYVVPKELAGDCGAMIAWTGLLMYKADSKKKYEIDIFTNWKTDEVEINWI